MQLGMFMGSKPFKITKPIRLIELFAGIGSQTQALKNIGVDFEHYRICEFDKYAVASYNAIHGTNFETSDITKITADDLAKVDTDKYCYIMTYSFPCQDLSKAGKGKGMAKDSGTRSGLLWEVERLLKETKHLPQVLLMENVPDVIGTKNIADFAKWVEFLESLGYKCFWERLNAKDYGIPQNRDRCFMVSVLGDYYYHFPQPKKLELRLKDMLEPVVDNKFYLSPQLIKFFTFNTLKQKEKGNGFKFEPTDGDCIAKSITTRAGGRMDDNFIKEPCCVEVDNLNFKFESANRVYSSGGISPTINTCGGGQREPKILEPLVHCLNQYDENGKQRKQHERVYDTDGVMTALCQGQGGRHNIIEPLAYDEQNQTLRLDRTVGTLTTDGSSPKHNNRVVEPLESTPIEIICKDKLYRPKFVQENGEVEVFSITVNGKEIGIIKQNDSWYAVRKLTPKECWRLMGFDDADFEKAEKVNSNSQLYKQAGNSIVVNVLEKIFKKML